MTTTAQAIREAFSAFLAADDDWHREIVKAFPRQWSGDVRYTKASSGQPGTPLAAAYERYHAARVAWERLVYPHLYASN